MSTRGYVALESDKSCCSLITVLLFLDRCCPDRSAFLAGLSNVLKTSGTAALD